MAASIFGFGSIKVFVTFNDTTDFKKRDLIFEDIKFDTLSEDTASTQNGAVASYEVSTSLIRFEDPGSGGSFKIQGKADDLLGKDLELYNYDSVIVTFDEGSLLGADVMLDGAESGDLELTHFDDIITNPY